MPTSNLTSSFDTETYGTDFSDRMFAYSIGNGVDIIYVDIRETPEGEWLDHLKAIFSEPERTWYMHNAQFDLIRLHHYGIKVAGRVHDTMIIEKLLFNAHLQYTLNATATRYKYGLKEDAVKIHIKNHKLHTKQTDPVTGTERKLLHFDRVPNEIMEPYAKHDARLTYWIGEAQRKELSYASRVPAKAVTNIFKITKIAHEMTTTGVRIDGEALNTGIRQEKIKQARLKERLDAYLGVPFVDGKLWLTKAFDKLEVPYKVNPETNNPIFNKKELGKLTAHKVVQDIMDIRVINSRLSNVHAPLLRHYEKNNGICHPNIKVWGATTSRFSCNDPNLHGTPKQEDTVFDLSLIHI